MIKFSILISPRSSPNLVRTDILPFSNSLSPITNKYGVLNKKEFYDKDDMNNIKFASTITQNDIKKENFVYGFLSSIRQKMQVKRK